MGQEPLGEWYRAARERITAVVNDEVGGVSVPATPDWDVHDVVAHLAGIAEDARTGNMAGVTTDPWTAAQVERGRSKTVAALVAQWSADAPGVEWFLSTPEGAEGSWRAVLDIHTHEADILNALDHPVQLPVDFLAWVSGRLLGSFHESVAAANLTPVRVVADDLDVFRGRLGRRTVDEVCSFGWSADPAAYLDLWFIFGRAEHSLGER
ncbi:MAG: maleylpyruvate isomerase N-terminal domain-containing protein [Ilumatobacteraceae bacterium]